MAALRRKEKVIASKGISLNYILVVLVVFMVSHDALLLSSSSSRASSGGPSGFLLLAEAHAQSANPQAIGKYEAGLNAMKKGDCNAAKALFKEAVAMDAQDRTVRVGMFNTEYHPNAKLREAEAKCPTPPPVAKVAPSAPPTPPAETAEKPAISKVEEKPSAPAPPPPPVEVQPTPAKPIEVKPEYINHRVFAGETWESIAKWYLGDANRGKEIATRNPNLSSGLKAGDVVKIPKELATAHNKQPAHSTAPEQPRPAARTQPPAPAAAPPPPAPAPKPAPPKIEGLPGVFGPK